MHNDRQFLVINGRNLMDFGVYLFGEIPHVVPKRDVEEITVPGRNGSLTIDNGRWENVEIEYQLVMLGNGDKRIDDLVGFLISLVGQVKIEDSREPEYYRLGRLIEMPNWNAIATAGTLHLRFDCRPEKWFNDNQKIDVLNDGETISSRKEVTLINPTEYDAHPLLHLQKNTTAGLGITFNNYFYDDDMPDTQYYHNYLRHVYTCEPMLADLEMWVDCETGEAYNQLSVDVTVNLNAYCQFSNPASGYLSSYPAIYGNRDWTGNYNPLHSPLKRVNTRTFTVISLAASVWTVAEVYPRWWKL